MFLFDEPLSNLDAKLRVAMRLEIRRLHQRLDATSVFVTHDQIEAMTLADRLVVMNQGNIDQVGTPTEIYDTPASAYVAGFIGAPPMNLLPGTISEDGQVRLTDGQAVPLPSGWPDAHPGRRVLFGIRPEALSFVPMAGAAPLTMVLDFQEELGMGRLFHGRLGDDELIVHSSDKTPPAAFGAPVQVHMAPADIHLFDADTGLRLGADAPLSVAAQ